MVESNRSSDTSVSPNQPWFANRRVTIALSIVLALVAFVALMTKAWYRIFRNMQCYDDEGYMLIQIKLFLSGKPLYDDIVTLFGPTYFLLSKIAFRVLPFGHDGIRLWTFASLGVAAVLGGVCVQGLTRRFSLAVIGTLIVGLKLIGPLSDEPGHPQFVVAILLTGIAAALAWWPTRHQGLMAAVIGAMVATLGMTKINIGGYAAIPVLLGLLLTSGDDRRITRLARNGLMILMILMPLMLMNSHGRTWKGLAQASFYILPILAVLGTILSNKASACIPRQGLGPVFSYILAGIVVSASLCSFAVLNGTSLRGLLEIVRMPSQTLGVWGDGPAIHKAYAEAVLSLVIAAFYAYRARRGMVVSEYLTAALKIFFACSVLAPPLGIRPGHTLNGWGLFMWVALIKMPNRGSDLYDSDKNQELDLPRLALALLAVLQPLQSYPVSGSQIPIGTLLMIPLGLTCLFDVSNWLVSRGADLEVLLKFATFSAATIVVSTASDAVREREAYLRSVPLNFPGSSLIRLSERQVSVLHWLVANLDHSCTSFLCPTGFNSLYIWTDKEPPSHIIQTNELAIFTGEQQQRLLSGIKESPQPLIVDHPNHFQPPAPLKTRPQRPKVVLDGIASDFVAYSGKPVDGYTLKALKGQPTPEMVECAVEDPHGSMLLSSAVVNLLPKSGRIASRIQIVEVAGKSIGALNYKDADDHVLADSRTEVITHSLELQNESGEQLNLPLNLDPGARFVLNFPPPEESLPNRLRVVRFLDHDGKLITSVPLVNAAVTDNLADANPEDRSSQN